MNPELIRRLIAAGVDPSTIDNPETAWLRLAEAEGRRATLLDRYALEAAHRGIAVADIPGPIRHQLDLEVLAIQYPGIEMLSPGGDDPVEVVPYDTTWPTAFGSWHTRLEAALGGTARGIEHIGSTAVPGLAAKPVIDIQVTVGDLDNEALYAPHITSLGIPLRIRDLQRRYFCPPPDQARVVQVHVTASGSEWERNHLLFRDYLRAHDPVRDEYATVKRDLALTYRNDRVAYTEGKTDFILTTLDQAAPWAKATGWTVEPTDS